MYAGLVQLMIDHVLQSRKTCFKVLWTASVPSQMQKTTYTILSNVPIQVLLSVVYLIMYDSNKSLTDWSHADKFALLQMLQPMQLYRHCWHMLHIHMDGLIVLHSVLYVVVGEWKLYWLTHDKLLNHTGDCQIANMCNTWSNDTLLKVMCYCSTWSATMAS